jgi:hypothetical protein
MEPIMQAQQPRSVHQRQHSAQMQQIQQIHQMQQMQIQQQQSMQRQSSGQFKPDLSAPTSNSLIDNRPRTENPNNSNNPHHNYTTFGRLFKQGKMTHMMYQRMFWLKADKLLYTPPGMLAPVEAMVIRDHSTIDGPIVKGKYFGFRVSNEEEQSMTLYAKSKEECLLWIDALKQVGSLCLIYFLNKRFQYSIDINSMFRRLQLSNLQQPHRGANQVQSLLLNI